MVPQKMLKKRELLVSLNISDVFPANGNCLRRVPPAYKTNIAFKGKKVKGGAAVGAGSAQFVSLSPGAQRRASLLACRCYRGALALASDFLTDFAVR